MMKGKKHNVTQSEYNTEYKLKNWSRCLYTYVTFRFYYVMG